MLRVQIPWEYPTLPIPPRLSKGEPELSHFCLTHVQRPRKATKVNPNFVDFEKGEQKGQAEHNFLARGVIF